MVSSDQPGGSYGNKDAYIESLLQQLHEKDSIISELKKKDQPPSSSRQEDGSIDAAEAVLQDTPNEDIDEETEETAGKDVGASTQSSHRASHGLSLRGSTVTWGDFLQGAKQMHAKHKQLVSKQAWYSSPAQRIRWGGDQSCSMSTGEICSSISSMFPLCTTWECWDYLAMEPESIFDQQSTSLAHWGLCCHAGNFT